MAILVRKATADDKAALLRLARDFVGEAVDYGFRYDEARATAYIDQVTHDDDFIVMVGFDDGTGDVLAFCIAAVDIDFCGDLVAFVSRLYVAPAARGSGVARQFVAVVQSFADGFGCSHIFCTATAGMGEATNKLCANLFKKFGYEEIGPVMVRRMSP
jgi:GNAT superfamily N-acetyltransferase